MKSIEEIKRHFGCKKIQVHAQKRSAVFYEKMGFEKVGVRKNFYSAPTENAILYTLQLKKEKK